MQSSPLVQNIRLAGLVLGFVVFAFTTVRLIQHIANVEAVQHSPLIAQTTTR